MGKATVFSFAAIAIGVLVLTLDAAIAVTKLDNTSWSSPPDAGCGIYVTFNLDGTATVSKTESMATHRDTAHWTQEGSELHLTYDSWGGGLDGSFWEGGVNAGQAMESIHATETYQDDTGFTHTRECIFEQEK